VVEKFLLPDERRYTKPALYTLAGPFFPKSKKDREPLRIKLWSAEEMDMIRHDYITANYPAMTLARRAPFLGQGLCYFFAREDCTSSISARCDEVDWVLDPDPLKSPQMLTHTQL
jgi:hypothetical protein